MRWPVLACVVVVLGTGCWGTPSECRLIPFTARRDRCYSETLPELFASEPEGAHSMVQERVSDPRTRDFIYLTVTRRVDPGNHRWCGEIKDQALADRCRVLVGRPHLHRELNPALRPGDRRGEPPTDPPGEGPG